MKIDCQDQFEFDLIVELIEQLKSEKFQNQQLERGRIKADELSKETRENYASKYMNNNLDKIADLNLRFLIFYAQMNSHSSFINEILYTLCNVDQDGALNKNTLKKINESDPNTLKINLIEELIQCSRTDEEDIFDETSINKITNMIVNNKLKERLESIYIKGFDSKSATFIIGNESDILISDVATVLSVYYNPEIKEQYKEIKFSLDPVIKKDSNFNEQEKVCWPDKYVNQNIIGNTEFANVLFESDILLKYMALGIDMDGHSQFQFPEELQQLGLQSWASMLPQESSGLMSRFWLTSESCSYSQINGIYIIDDISVSCQARQMEFVNNKLVDKVKQDTKDASYIFAEKITKFYNILALYFPIFERLKQLFKAVALGKWIYEKKISIDYPSLKQFQNYFDTEPKIINLIKTEEIINQEEIPHQYTQAEKFQDVIEMFHEQGLPSIDILIDAVVERIPDVRYQLRQTYSYIQGGIDPNCKNFQKRIQAVVDKYQKEVNIPFSNQFKCENKQCKRLIEDYLRNINEKNCSLHSDYTCSQCLKNIPTQQVLEGRFKGLPFGHFYPTVSVQSHQDCQKQYHNQQQSIIGSNNFEINFGFIKQVEGGKTDSSIDRGGKTNCGIDEESYPEFCKRRKIAYKHPFDLTKDEIQSHYQWLYKASHSDKVKNFGTQLLYFDAIVNQGEGGGRTAIRRAMGIKEIPSHKELASLMNKVEDQTKLQQAIIQARWRGYKETVAKDPTQIGNLDGWQSRLNQAVECVNKNTGSNLIPILDKTQKQLRQEKQKQKKQK